MGRSAQREQWGSQLEGLQHRYSSRTACDKILEINVFTPGGLWGMSKMYKTDFAEAVIISLESKLAIRSAYPSSISNRELGTL